MFKLNSKLSSRHEGISPVISTMLIFVLVLTIVTAVLLWSIPTIHNIEATAQHIVAIGEFSKLTDELRNAVFNGEGTNKSIYLKIDAGKLYFTNDEAWLISYVMPAYQGDITYTGLDDGDQTFELKLTTTPTTELRVRVWLRSSNAAVATEGYEKVVDYSFGTVSEVTVTASKSLTGVVRIEVFDGTLKLGEAWLIEFNPLEHKLITLAGTYHIRSSNGCVATDYPTGKQIRDTPQKVENHKSSLYLYVIRYIPIGVSSTGPGKHAVDMRLVKMEVQPAVATTKVKRVRIEAFGDYAEAWYTKLTEQKERRYQGDIIEYIGFVKDHNSVRYQVPNEHNPEFQDLLEFKLVLCEFSINLRKA